LDAEGPGSRVEGEAESEVPARHAPVEDGVGGQFANEVLGPLGDGRRHVPRLQ
jgi:hypothetical protein